MSHSYEKAVKHTFAEIAWSEDFVQNLIANDPSVLQLGDLKLQERERRQPGGGRLDLLLQSSDDTTRFTVEVQNSATDPSHIVRSIEYWNIERRRFPQYEHVAVIVASEITSRYFNVIGLFNQYIPVIAMKMEPISIGDRTTLVFTKVLDYLLPEAIEVEPVISKSSVSEWREKTSQETIDSMEAIVSAARVVSAEINPKYNKSYVQLKIGASFFKLLTLWPKKAMLQMELPINQSLDVEEKLDGAKIRYLDYDERRRRYMLILLPQDASRNSKLLTELIGMAYSRSIIDGKP